MIEMTETASILQHATKRSLVIMDEVGRGTATMDGCAIAYATLHHLYHVNMSRALFATHYHELADMVGAVRGCYYGFEQGRLLSAVDKAQKDKEDTNGRMNNDVSVAAPVVWRGQQPLEHVRCYQTTLEKLGDGSFTYMHHVVPGVCRQSHGIHVAKLAGMPRSAVEVSERILRVLQEA
jgi:DNA mismatch repair ATPase MutS